MCLVTQYRDQHLDGRIIASLKQENRKLLKTMDVTKYNQCVKYLFFLFVLYFLLQSLAESFRLGMYVQTGVTQEGFTLIWSSLKHVGRVTRFQQNLHPNEDLKLLDMFMHKKR